MTSFIFQDVRKHKIGLTIDSTLRVIPKTKPESILRSHSIFNTLCELTWEEKPKSLPDSKGKIKSSSKGKVKSSSKGKIKSSSKGKTDSNSTNRGPQHLQFVKMINLLMRCGKRGKAASLFYFVFNKLNRRISEFRTKSVEYAKHIIQQNKQMLFDCSIDARNSFLGFPFSFSLVLIMELFYFIKRAITGLLESPSVKNQPQPVVDNLNSFSLIKMAVANVMPVLEVRKVRVKGTTRQVPSMMKEKRQQALALRWLIEGAKNRTKRSKIPLPQSLSSEILDAFKKQGSARQKRNELHKTAQSNRSFLRFRWW